jgi:hypothetical protein
MTTVKRAFCEIRFGHDSLEAGCTAEIGISSDDGWPIVQPKTRRPKIELVREHIHTSNGASPEARAPISSNRKLAWRTLGTIVLRSSIQWSLLRMAEPGSQLAPEEALLWTEEASVSSAMNVALVRSTP